VNNDVAFAPSSVQIFCFNSTFRGIRRAAFLRVLQNKNGGFFYELDANPLRTDKPTTALDSLNKPSTYVLTTNHTQRVRSSIGAGHIRTCVRELCGADNEREVDELAELVRTCIDGIFNEHVLDALGASSRG